MFYAYGSDEERRLQLMQDGIVLGDIDGFDYIFLAESLLHVLLHNNMIHIPIADVHVSHWKREACEVVRIYLCSHDDERLNPIQRDQHNRVCDV